MLLHTVPAGTAADGYEAARVVCMTAPAQNDLPQAQQRPARKLMPSTRPVKTLLWPRRSPAAGLGSPNNEIRNYWGSRGDRQVQSALGVGLGARRPIQAADDKVCSRLADDQQSLRVVQPFQARSH